MAINRPMKKYICRFCKKENPIFLKDGDIGEFFECDCFEFKKRMAQNHEKQITS